jgi:hypothetical protein
VSSRSLPSRSARRRRRDAGRRTPSVGALSLELRRWTHPRPKVNNIGTGYHIFYKNKEMPVIILFNSVEKNIDGLWNKKNKL